MGNHIVHSYDQELESITTQVIDMGLLVRDLLHIAEKALNTPGESMVESAKATDKKVNALDMQIEREAVSMLALRQPMAIDLRFAVSVLKIAVIMERMGDLAKNAVKRSAKMSATPSAATQAHISTMVDIITTMLKEVLEAFKQHDAEKAHQVVMRDGEVDVIYRELMDTLQAEMMAAPETIPSAMQCIFAIKNLERIGDYITKTAKIVHYIVSGERAPKIAKQPASEKSAL